MHPLIEEALKTFDEKFPYSIKTVKHNGIHGVFEEIIINLELKSFLKTSLQQMHDATWKEAIEEAKTFLPREDDTCVRCKIIISGLDELLKNNNS